MTRRKKQHFFHLFLYILIYSLHGGYNNALRLLRNWKREKITPFLLCLKGCSDDDDGVFGIAGPVVIIDKSLRATISCV
jgi:hypothetical protein